ncbi:hypothetical protein [Curtobacterium sp. 458]|uniref:hypothetical protein n=1 Tax=Curtobacterium sp. 458 TaxID=3050069 RepID=UPI0025B2CEFA|nr:hypothetical protein [Curtobacterium sp. 458]WJY00856.1 hypothetical protein QPJ90_03945 [Curtobacterium sp. 458]
MNRRPDPFPINIAFDVTGVHGQVFFRDPPSTVSRQIIIRSTDTGTICEPALGDTRTGWEPFFEELRRRIAAAQTDTREERS